MKILHTADLHLGYSNCGKPDPVTGVNTRWLDQKNAWLHMCRRAYEEKADLVVFAGDAFKERRPHPWQLLSFVDGLFYLSESGIPAVVIPGNHDTPGANETGIMEVVRAFDLPGIHVVTEPALLEVAGLQVACLPACHLGHIEATAGAQAGDRSLTASALLGASLLGLAAQVDTFRPAICVAHWPVDGCVAGSEATLSVRSTPAIPREAIRQTKGAFDAILLGDIHKRQQIEKEPLCYYPGSPVTIDFGEENEPHGFAWFEISGGLTRATFEEIPQRRWVTVDVEVTEADVFNPTDYVAEECGAYPVEGSIVRVRVSGYMEGLRTDEITRQLYEWGAHHVAGVEIKSTRSLRARDEHMTEQVGVGEALARWLRAQGHEEPRVERVVGLAEQLERGLVG